MATRSDVTASFFEERSEDGGEPRFKWVRCAECQEALRPAFHDLEDVEGGWSHLYADGALHVRLYGVPGELIAAREPGLHLLLCAACAAALFRALPSAMDAARPHLEIDHAHICVAGRVSWRGGRNCPIPGCPAR